MKKDVQREEALLRQLIKEELNEMSMSQAKVHGPLKKFVDHMNGAKQALSELYQSTSDQKAATSVHALLGAVNRIVKALDHMPELSQVFKSTPPPAPQAPAKKKSWWSR